MAMLPFQSVQAGMIGTDQVASAANGQADRATVLGFMNRSEVAGQLQAMMEYRASFLFGAVAQALAYGAEALLIWIMVAHFDGIETFAGASFHSARWDHSVRLDGERVGVIGTGSTAVQITTALVPRVGRFDSVGLWTPREPEPETDR